jgi:hypothetical protein
MLLDKLRTALTVQELDRPVRESGRDDVSEARTLDAAALRHE